MSLQNHYTGAASEFLVAAILSEQGYDVFFPDTPSRADLLYTTTGMTPVRVQVKTSTRAQTGPFIYEQAHLNAKKHGRPYTAEEVDEVWVVGTHVWRFPIGIVAGFASLSLCKNGPQTRPSKIYNADEYIVKRGTWENPIRNIFSLDTADAAL